MQVNGRDQTTIWYDHGIVSIIDQTRLPHQFDIIQLTTLEDFCQAIRTMQVRGAPLIGVTAAYGLALTMKDSPSNRHLESASRQLLATRPTAVNLAWAIKRMQATITAIPEELRFEAALNQAHTIRSEDIETCAAIGQHGLAIITAHQSTLSSLRPINILTHCNAGWLATVDWGTALAPIYKAHQAGIPIHVWVDETRPRNQGSSLTAWELQQQGIAHTVIADNTGGHLMQHGKVDLCIVGSDRTTARGDVCNKIGTYLKALSAIDNNVPFYVALPSSTIDWSIEDGIANIPIEERDVREVTHINGLDSAGNISEIQLVANSPALNYAFDVTPARLVSGLITEQGMFSANKASLQQLQQQLNKAGSNL